MAIIDAGSFQILTGGAFSGFPDYTIIVDWNNDDVFSSSEEITGDVLSVDWGRGRDPEEENTPAGFATIIVSDPSGNYAPASDFWGAGNVTMNRRVQAISVYKDTTYHLFDQRLQRLTPDIRPGNDQRTTLFFVDEMELLDNKIISHPNLGLTSADDNLGKLLLSGVADLTFGSTSDGAIKNILDESSFSSTKRTIAQTGSTAEFWWTYGVSARAALKEIERHEGQKSMIFINSSGSVEFHSSTHREGSASVASFGFGSADGLLFQSIAYEMSAKNVVNVGEVTSHIRADSTLDIIAAIPLSPHIIANGDTFAFIIRLDKPPVQNAIIPEANKDSTAGFSIISAPPGVTSYASADNDKLIQAEFFGASAARIVITNNVGESVLVDAPETAIDQNNIAMRGFVFQDQPITSCNTDAASIGVYNRRAEVVDFPFFGDTNLTKNDNLAQDLVRNNSTAHASNITFHLEGSDSNSIVQVLIRDLNERITINSTGNLGITNTDFYITRGDWSIQDGGHILVDWTLQEAT